MVSNNPYTLSSVAGFGSRGELNSGVLAVTSVSINRTADVNRLVALEAAGHPERFVAGGSGPRADLQVLGPSSVAAAVDGEARNLAPPLRFTYPTGRTPRPHRPRTTRSLARLASCARDGIDAGGSGPCGARPAERDRRPSRPGAQHELSRPHRGVRDGRRAGHVLAADVRRDLVHEADALDRSIHDAVASTPTPTLDVPMTWISNAATYSRLWVVIAAVLAVAGGHRGRRAAVRGSTAIGATLDYREPRRETPGAVAPAGNIDQHGSVRDAHAEVELLPLGARGVGVRICRGGDGRVPTARVAVVRAGNCRRPQPRPHRGALPQRCAGRCSARPRRRHDGTDARWTTTIALNIAAQSTT